ncbi:MAG: hypothetical protein FH753_10935 [Firmicutes bacterium]|nr:hypothetical protein [Bacillota bacterium]
MMKILTIAVYAFIISIIIYRVIKFRKMINEDEVLFFLKAPKILRYFSLIFLIVSFYLVFFTETENPFLLAMALSPIVNTFYIYDLVITDKEIFIKGKYIDYEKIKSYSFRKYSKDKSQLRIKVKHKNDKTLEVFKNLDNNYKENIEKLIQKKFINS